MDTDTDISGPLLELAGSIKIGLDGVGKHINKANRIQAAAAKADQPVLFNWVASGVIPASGLLVISGANDGPMQGRFWYVRNLVVSGVTPGNDVSGRADVFVTAMDLRNATNIQQFSALDWRDQSAAIPNVAYYGRGEFPVKAGEILQLLISQATPGQQIVSSARIEEFEEAAFQEGWGL